MVVDCCFIIKALTVSRHLLSLAAGACGQISGSFLQDMTNGFGDKVRQQLVAHDIVNLVALYTAVGTFRVKQAKTFWPSAVKGVRLV